MGESEDFSAFRLVGGWVGVTIRYNMVDATYIVFTSVRPNEADDMTAFTYIRHTPIQNSTCQLANAMGSGSGLGSGSVLGRCVKDKQQSLCNPTAAVVCSTKYIFSGGFEGDSDGVCGGLGGGGILRVERLVRHRP